MLKRCIDDIERHYKPEDVTEEIIKAYACTYTTNHFEYALFIISLEQYFNIRK